MSTSASYVPRYCNLTNCRGFCGICPPSGPSKEYAAKAARSWRRHVIAGYAIAVFCLCAAAFCLWAAPLWLGIPLFAFNCWNAWQMFTSVPSARRRAEAYERGEWPEAGA